jgi:hypothetical protein
MRQITDVICNHIATEHPGVTFWIEELSFEFGENIGWAIHCMSKGPEYVQGMDIEVFPEEIELKKSDQSRVKLLWESPETFKIIDNELRELSYAN